MPIALLILVFALLPGASLADSVENGKKDFPEFGAFESGRGADDRGGPNQVPQFCRRRNFDRGDVLERQQQISCIREPARQIARLLDIAAAPELRARMTYASPKTGAPVWQAGPV